MRRRDDTMRQWQSEGEMGLGKRWSQKKTVDGERDGIHVRVLESHTNLLYLDTCARSRTHTYTKHTM